MSVSTIYHKLQPPLGSGSETFFNFSYDVYSDQWKLTHPNGKILVLSSYMVEELKWLGPGLISSSKANRLVREIFGTSLENLMGIYDEKDEALEGWWGDYDSPPSGGSLPVPRSPTPPPPPIHIVRSVRNGFGRKSKRSLSAKKLQRFLSQHSVDGGRILLLVGRSPQKRK